MFSRRALLLVIVFMGIPQSPIFCETLRDMGFRECTKSDLYGYWLMVAQGLKPSDSDGTEYSWPYQLIYFKSDGTSKDIQKNKKPINKMDIDALSLGHGDAKWAVDRDGWLTIGEESNHQFECFIATKSVRRKSFPSEIETGDLFLVYADPKAGKQWGARVFTKMRDLDPSN